MAKKKLKRESYYWRVAYTYQDPKAAKKFWQERKRGFQKLQKLDEKRHQVQQELNRATIERIDGFLKEYEKENNK